MAGKYFYSGNDIYNIINTNNPRDSNNPMTTNTVYFGGFPNGYSTNYNDEIFTYW